MDGSGPRGMAWLRPGKSRVGRTVDGKNDGSSPMHQLLTLQNHPSIFHMVAIG